MNEQQLRKYAELLLNGEWIRNYDADAVFLAVRFPPGTDLSSMGSREDAIAKLVHLSKNPNPSGVNTMPAAAKTSRPEGAGHCRHGHSNLYERCPECEREADSLPGVRNAAPVATHALTLTVGELCDCPSVELCMRTVVRCKRESGNSQSHSEEHKNDVLEFAARIAECSPAMTPAEIAARIRSRKSGNEI